MDKVEALKILQSELFDFRSMKYAELVGLLDTPLNYERKGSSGTAYQVEAVVLWDHPSQQGGDIRVIVSIDDGKFPHALVPMTEDFIMDADGKIVGEQGGKLESNSLEEST